MTKKANGHDDDDCTPTGVLPARDDEIASGPQQVDLAVVNPLHIGIVRALSNHAIVLDATKREVALMRDRYQSRPDDAPPSELRDLAQIFRKEGDSAHAVASAAEETARRAR